MSSRSHLLHPVLFIAFLCCCCYFLLYTWDLRGLGGTHFICEIVQCVCYQGAKSVRKTCCVMIQKRRRACCSPSRRSSRSASSKEVCSLASFVFIVFSMMMMVVYWRYLFCTSKHAMYWFKRWHNLSWIGRFYFKIGYYDCWESLNPAFSFDKFASFRCPSIMTKAGKTLNGSHEFFWVANSNDNPQLLFKVAATGSLFNKASNKSITQLELLNTASLERWRAV